jgi:hypothetical protein
LHETYFYIKKNVTRSLYDLQNVMIT